MSEREVILGRGGGTSNSEEENLIRIYTGVGVVAEEMAKQLKARAALPEDPE